MEGIAKVATKAGKSSIFWLLSSFFFLKPR